MGVRYLKRSIIIQVQRGKTQFPTVDYVWKNLQKHATSKIIFEPIPEGDLIYVKNVMVNLSKKVNLPNMRKFIWMEAQVTQICLNKIQIGLRQKTHVMT